MSNSHLCLMMKVQKRKQRCRSELTGQANACRPRLSISKLLGGAGGVFIRPYRKSGSGWAAGTNSSRGDMI